MVEGEGKVGYKRSPIEHRFGPGRSGNPAGRPKGSHSVPEEIRAVLRKQISVTDNGQKRKISLVEATTRRLAEKAIQGDLRAIQQVLALAEAYGVEPGKAALPSEDQALIEAALLRLSSRGGGQ